MTAPPGFTSPKQPQVEHRRDWYPYYAGFTASFVEGVLTAQAPEARTVMDPWNGSGTTTAVCARLGREAAGIDLNPVLTVIARARLTPCNIVPSLRPLGAEILEAAHRRQVSVEHGDLLGTWLRRPAIERFRAVQDAIHAVLSDVPDRGGRPISVLADGLPILAAFYYSALFATARDVLGRFRSTNPTWVREPRTPRHRLNPGWEAIEARFLARIQYLAPRLTVPGPVSPAVDIQTASSTTLPFASDSFDVAITSPPYATRIDYVKGVLPELALLGASEDEIRTLRSHSTGSPVVRGAPIQNVELLSDYGVDLLRRIKRHTSKGSRSYYHPWMTNYFRSLQEGLREIDRAVVPGGTICIVAQDSQYKELHVDLQRFVTETMASLGRGLADRRDHEVKHHMARINPRARIYVSRPTSSESLLTYR